MPNFTHDLASFVAEFNFQIEQDYQQIRNRAKEDPGTAGDQAETTWRELLRRWIPSHYHVETKGRILGANGKCSPQVDVVVLSPNYPVGLLGKKLYLAAGVVAAFECKLTLRPHHIKEVFQNRVAMREVVDQEWNERRNLARMAGRDYAFEEYHGVFDYGILAHSHEGFGTNPSQSMVERIESSDRELVTNPADMVDLVCVQNLGCWTGIRAPYLFGYRGSPPSNLEFFSLPIPQSGYDGLTNETWAAGTKHATDFSPLGAFLSRFWTKLSRRDHSLTALARYFHGTLSAGSSAGMSRSWQDLPTPPDLWEMYVARGILSGSDKGGMLHYELGFGAF